MLSTLHVLQSIINYLKVSKAGVLCGNSMLTRPINKFLARMRCSIGVFSKARHSISIAKLTYLNYPVL